jgi:phosphate transport system substrate-binding protein
MKTKAIALGLLGVMLVAGSAYAKTLEIKGSDTMVQLGMAWAEAYTAKSGKQVAVTGGGSGIGISALVNNTCDIAQASRTMKDAEILDANKNGVNPKATVVAWDGLSVIVNPKNAVKELTIEQLSAIFTGAKTNWKDFGGADAPIVVTTREIVSGTHVFFKEHILQMNGKIKTAEYRKDALVLNSNQAIVAEVGGNENAIGYVGLGYLKDTVKALGVAEAAGKAFVKPSADAVLDKSYPVARPLHWYTNGRPAGDTLKFVQFVLSDEGQKIVKDLDFVTVRKL